LSERDTIAAAPSVPPELRAEGRRMEVDRSSSVIESQDGSDLSHHYFSPSIQDTSRLPESLWKINAVASTGRCSAI
jgi:hypothetical protein